MGVKLKTVHQTNVDKFKHNPGPKYDGKTQNNVGNKNSVKHKIGSEPLANFATKNGVPGPAHYNAFLQVDPTKVINPWVLK